MYLGETNKELVIGNIYIVQPDNSKWNIEIEYVLFIEVKSTI